MTTSNDIFMHLNELFPASLAEEWDNVGVLLGRSDKKVNKVLLTLDVDEKVAYEAVENGADLIISHHPLIFNPIKSITADTASGRMIFALIQNDISVYSAHTNLDAAKGGLNDYAASLLGLAVEGALCDETSLGRYGRFESEYTLKDILSICKDKFYSSNIRFVGDLNKKIKRAAVVTGSGMSVADKCYDKDIDLFITGDVKYSGAREASSENLSIIDLGHYGSEYIAVDLLHDVLSEKFKDVEFIKSKSNTDIFDTF